MKSMDVAVLGADGAGRDVARLCLLAGHDVALHDEDVDAVMAGVDAVEGALAEAVADGTLTEDDRAAAADCVEATTGLEAAAGGAGIVVEATGGDRDARRELFAAVEEVVGDDALIATTGTGSVTAVAAGLRRPGRAVGLQFVDPPAVPLVEVAVADQTTDRTRDRGRSFAEGLDREVVVVRDAPGLAAGRLSLALSVEAMGLVDEGVAGVAAVDRALEAGHGHPIGPLAAADEAGLDTRLEQLETLAASLGERFAPPPLLREKVADGELGRKTGTGFYVWEDGEPSEPAEPDPTAQLRDERPPGPGEG